MPLPLVGPLVLGAGAYYLARKGRQEQLQKDVAAQSKALTSPAGFGGSHRRKHHGGIHGDRCPSCVGFGAVAARPAPPTGQISPPVQRTTGIAVVARPAPPRVAPVLRPFNGGYGGGWTAASAKLESERIAAAQDPVYSDDVVYADGGGDDDVVYETGYIQNSYDMPRYGYGYGRRHW